MSFFTRISGLFQKPEAPSTASPTQASVAPTPTPVATPVASAGAPNASFQVRTSGEVPTVPVAPVIAPTTASAVSSPAAKSLTLSANAWPAFVKAEAAKKGVVKKEELAMLLGHLDHECGGFRTMEESFAYSAANLLRTFPRYVKSLEDAQNLLRQGAKAVGDRVYGGRMGNSPTEGWLYRGRGPIQLTGKNNYTHIGGILRLDLVKHPELLLDAHNGMQSALAFWFHTAGLREAAQRGDVVRVTSIINGGSNGLADRRTKYAQYLRTL